MTLYWKDGNGRNWPVCSCLQAWLPVYQAELKRLGVIKYSLDVFQTIGGAAASGGTHSTGQCVDTAQRSDKAIWVARQMGADASWNRRYNWDGRGGMAHAHLNLRGCPHGTDAADRQYYSTYTGVDHGKNGLANGAADDGPRPLSKRTYTQGIAWAKARQAAAAAAALPTYYVAGPFALGHETPGARVRRVGEPVPCGTAMKITKMTTSGNALWGRVEPAGAEPRWYLMANLSLEKPAAKIERVDWFSVGEYAMSAQADHAENYPDRAPLIAANMVAEDCNVWAAVDYGDATLHANGKSFEQISDEARQAAGGLLAKMVHGEDGRELLYQDGTVAYVPNSGRSKTVLLSGELVPVTLATFTKFGVKHVVAAFDFDVSADSDQLRAATLNLLAVVTDYRNEMGVGPWNVTIAGNTHTGTDHVRAAMSAWGYVAAGEYAPEQHQSSKRTDNKWINEWVVGPRMDEIFVAEGTPIMWRQTQDATASSHNRTKAVRASYGTPAVV